MALRVACRRFSAVAAGGAIKVDIALVGKLRKETNLSISRCKDALLASNNDYSSALVWLQEKEQELAQQKADKVKGRATVEGSVIVRQLRQSATMVEMNTETDFAARNENFVKLLKDIGETIAEYKSDTTTVDLIEDIAVTELASLKILGADKTISQAIIQTIGMLGENISLRRAVRLHSPGLIGAACLGGSSVMGRTGALIGARYTPTPFVEPKSEIVTFIHSLAQHVAGMNPLAFSPNDAALKHLSEQDAREAALLTQPFLFQQDITVRQAIQAAEKAAGLAEGTLAITNFVRYECGQGLEKPQSNFEEDVRKMNMQFSV